MSTTHTNSLFDIFFSVRQLRQGTAEIYKYAFRRLTGLLDGRKVEDVTPLEAMRFAKSLSESGLAAATANMYLRAVKTFFRWLVAVEKMSKNPFRDVKFFRDTKSGKGIYAPHEVQRMLDACRDDRWRLMIALAVTTGMRRGEILNLTVGEVDYAAGVITIRPKPRTETTWGWDLKDTETRQVPISGLTEPLLLRSHANLPPRQPYLCLLPTRYEHLMRLQRNGRLTYQTLKCPEVNFLRSFRGICRRAGVPYRSFHALRGSCFSQLADQGLQPHELQSLAGHSDFRTTYKHYIRSSETLSRVRNITNNGRYRT